MDPTTASGVESSPPGAREEEMTVADLRKARGSGSPPSWQVPGDDAQTQADGRPLAADSEPRASAPPPLPSSPLAPPDWEPPPLDSLAPPDIPEASLRAPRTALTPEPATFQTTTTGTAGVLGHEALRRENEERAVTGLRAIAVMSFVGLGILQLAPDKPATHALAFGALVLLAFMTGAGSYLLEKKVVTEEGPVGAAVLILATIVILALTAHIGVISPMPMALGVLVHFEGSRDYRARGVAIFTVASVGYLGLVILACLGKIQAILPVPLSYHIEPLSILLLGLAGEGLLATAYTIAVLGRKQTIEAIVRLESAQKEIRKRQALLDEARDELDRALDVARVGRFSGKQIGPYVAEDVIGRGGMGEVYRAVRTSTGDVVALKILHAQYQGEQAQLERFFREAEATSQLDSPHIVRVMERGTAPDGSPYLAMEYLVGYDLAHALRKHSRLGLTDAITMIQQVASGLSAAQEAGVVHRDVKPQNVFRARMGTTVLWKVLDFGVSKMSEVAGTLTHGAIVGTPGYMSPEQARGKPVDHRSDVFSLAVLAYRALTGRPPFHASDPLGTTYQVVHSMPVRPTDLVKVSEDIDLVLAIGLAKDREDRFRSASSFAAALRDASRGELDERLRSAARDLLRHHPWGTERRA